jgi:hypothetical protein
VAATRFFAAVVWRHEGRIQWRVRVMENDDGEGMQLKGRRSQIE